MFHFTNTNMEHVKNNIDWKFFCSRIYHLKKIKTLKDQCHRQLKSNRTTIEYSFHPLKNNPSMIEHNLHQLRSNPAMIEHNLPQPKNV